MVRFDPFAESRPGPAHAPTRPAVVGNKIFEIPVLTRAQKRTLRKVYLVGLVHPAAVYAAIKGPAIDFDAETR